MKTFKKWMFRVSVVVNIVLIIWAIVFTSKGGMWLFNVDNVDRHPLELLLLLATALLTIFNVMIVIKKANGK